MADQSSCSMLGGSPYGCLCGEGVMTNPEVTPRTAAITNSGVSFSRARQPSSTLRWPLAGSNRLPEEIPTLGLRRRPQRVSHLESCGNPGTSKLAKWAISFPRSASVRPRWPNLLAE